MAGANLERPNSKGVLESIIEELSGQRLVLKIEVNADIAIAPAPEITSPVPVESSALSLNSEQPKEREKAGAKAAEVQEHAVRMEAEFRNDPLISEAMKRFEAKLAK